MSWLDIRNKRKNSSTSVNYEDSYRVGLYSPDDEKILSDTLPTLPPNTITPNYLVDQVQGQMNTVMNVSVAHSKLGPLQHLLAIDLSQEELKIYLQNNKEAIPVILYCYYRFSKNQIPEELEYIGNKIKKIVLQYGGELLGKNIGGIRAVLRAHMSKNKDIDGSSRFLFHPKNNTLLIKSLESVVRMIKEPDENFMTNEKADTYLQELGLFIQNHCSVDSYLSYDKKYQGNWSNSTKFALSYFVGNVSPLDHLRKSQLHKLITETTQESFLETTSDTASQFAKNIEDETLSYGLFLLESKTKNLTPSVKETLRDRFTERHLIYWKGLKDQVTKYTKPSNIVR